VRLGDEDSHFGTAPKAWLHALPMHRGWRMTRFTEGSEIMLSMEMLSAASCKPAMVVMCSKCT
jgi:hypothetical protein